MYGSPRKEPSLIFFFFNDTATTEIYTLSLHDRSSDLHTRDLRHFVLQFLRGAAQAAVCRLQRCEACDDLPRTRRLRSEEHTSELQSQSNLVCRLLLEKKRKHQRQ